MPLYMPSQKNFISMKYFSSRGTVNPLHWYMYLSTNIAITRALDAIWPTSQPATVVSTLYSTVSWCGSAYPGDHPPTCLNLCRLFLLVQAAVHCTHLLRPGKGYLPLSGTSKTACSSFHHLLTTAFFAWPGLGAPLSRDLEEALNKAWFSTKYFVNPCLLVPDTWK